MELDDTLRNVPLSQIRHDAALAVRAIVRIGPTSPPEHQAVRRLVEQHIDKLLALADAAKRTVNRIPHQSRVYLR